ncbi:hypothetical protein GDO78_008322 [Eleutherodactylus coqui]|uniref:Uncharacterized protein n=1 Tax=Eleutherodactylus coqui TaxID=57060 RepID=A0A8J6FCM5_ELECQ|nr:hypothetical protein GDO78_008322 [Eleutherodactylus coqui]
MLCGRRYCGGRKRGGLQETILLLNFIGVRGAASSSSDSFWLLGSSPFDDEQQNARHSESVEPTETPSIVSLDPLKKNIHFVVF